MTAKTPEKQPPRPKGQHGGKRPGAGRKHRQGPDTPAASALEYLMAVARGEVEGDSLRVSAARAALPFEAPRQRAPVKAAPPSVLRRAETAEVETAQSEAWALTAARIRAKRAKA